MDKPRAGIDRFIIRSFGEAALDEINRKLAEEVQILLGKGNRKEETQMRQLSEHITTDDAEQILNDYWKTKKEKGVLSLNNYTLFFKADALNLIAYVWERCCEDRK